MKCIECGEPATWVRSTQFAGEHPYCTKHAHKEKDFGKNDSYEYWYELKYWTICFPGEHGQNVIETWSDQQILDSYWDYWCERMEKAGKDPEVHTFQDCIDDWCVGHWAVQTDAWGNKIEEDC